MDKVKKIMDDIKAGWEKMEKSKRIRLVSIVSIFLVLILTIAYFTQRTDYQVLFNDLEDADAGAIVEDIEARGMKYQLDKNGSTILIPKDEIDNYRIQLAVDDLLPSSSTGFEIFDSANMMATDEDRAIMYQRAISGELERAITSLDSVNSAKILLNIPEDSVFQNPEYSKDASASVVLDMRGSGVPDAQTIQGISSLVSGAVDNLPPENVKIVDTKGNLLSTPLNGGADDTSVVTAHQKIKKSIETDLENKVINLLGSIYGHDKVHVSVNAGLNFDAIEEENINYGVPEDSETDKGLIRSQTENVTGNAGLSSIVEGSVLEEGQVDQFLEDNQGEGDNSSYDHTTNYELNSSTARVIKAPGSIESLSASVVILANQGGSNPEPLVRNALGIDAELGNESIQIEYVEPMVEEDPELLPEFGLAGAVLAWLGTNWWIVLIGFIALVVLVVLARVLLSRRRAEPVEETEEYEEPVVERIDDEEVEEEEEITLSEEAKAKAREREISHQKEDEVRDHARENPELVAELLKIWLNEEK